MFTYSLSCKRKKSTGVLVEITLKEFKLTQGDIICLILKLFQLFKLILGPLGTLKSVIQQ